MACEHKNVIRIGERIQDHNMYYYCPKCSKIIFHAYMSERIMISSYNNGRMKELLSQIRIGGTL